MLERTWVGWIDPVGCIVGLERSCIRERERIVDGAVMTSPGMMLVHPCKVCA